MTIWDGFLKKLFMSKKLIYTAMGEDDYFKTVNKLSKQGIVYKTKIQNDMRSGSGYYHNKYRLYEIFVKTEDEHKAQEAIHHS